MKLEGISDKGIRRIAQAGEAKPVLADLPSGVGFLVDEWRSMADQLESAFDDYVGGNDMQELIAVIYDSLDGLSYTKDVVDSIIDFWGLKK